MLGQVPVTDPAQLGYFIGSVAAILVFALLGYGAWVRNSPLAWRVVWVLLGLSFMGLPLVAVCGVVSTYVLKLPVEHRRVLIVLLFAVSAIAGDRIGKRRGYIPRWRRGLAEGKE